MESFAEEFWGLLGDVSYGLVKKQNIYRKNIEIDESYRYFQTAELERSIQKLNLLMLRHGIVSENGEPIAPKNETDAVINYFSHSMQYWPTAKYNKFQNILDEELEPLIHLTNGKTKYTVTETCRELAMESLTYNQDMMQKQVFYLLTQLNQEQYVFCRKWIIQHPLMDRLQTLDLQDEMKTLGIEDFLMDTFIQTAYEQLPINAIGICGHCGWTVMKDINRYYCIESLCRKKTDNFNEIESFNEKNNLLRLKSGVMKYMMLPGRFEIELEKYCDKLGVACELWPKKDSYDLKISLPNKVYAVDIKSYFNPFSLKHHLMKNGVFNGIPNELEAYVVIPNYRQDRKKGYLEILKSVPKNRPYDFASLKEFQQMIKQMKGK